MTTTDTIAAAADALRDPEGMETFTFLAYCWNVTEAKRLAHDSGGAHAGTFEPAAWVRSFGSFVRINEPHLPHVDLTEPVLFAPLCDADTGQHLGLMLIDGWHRAHQAVRLGVETLPYVCLSETDERAIRLHPRNTPADLRAERAARRMARRATAAR